MRTPPALYSAPKLACGRCGQTVKPGQFGGWEHVRRLKVKDPRWHHAVPA